MVIINEDEYRAFHPHFDEIQAAYGLDAPAHTAAWSGRMVEAVVDTLSIANYNLIIEGTLRTAEVPLRTAELLKDRGYTVSLALMAVKPEISQISCDFRYEQMLAAGTDARAVDPAHHQQIIEAIVKNLQVLEASNVFDCISLYSRKGECLFRNDGGSGASQTLNRILFGDWTAEETEHLAYLQNKLASVKQASYDNLGHAPAQTSTIESKSL